MELRRGGQSASGTGRPAGLRSNSSQQPCSREDWEGSDVHLTERRSCTHLRTLWLHWTRPRAEFEEKGIVVRESSWGYRLLVVDDLDGNQLLLNYPSEDPLT
jgi:hypothetical protein